MNVVIFGANSEIAWECAKIYAMKGCNLFLVSRNADKLEVVANDLAARGAGEIKKVAQDLADIAKHRQLLDDIDKSVGEIDLAFVAYGTLSDQQRCESDAAETVNELNTNFISAAHLLTLLGNAFEKQKRGSIAIISSVAGDRGRASNYVYGSAKAALSAFSQGLRNRLSKAGVAVLTIKPGFVDTAMTAHLPKNALFASPSSIAPAICQAIEKRKDILYTPWFWRYIMLIIKVIPEKIFKRLSL